jgi:hypothetical protein
MMMITPDMFAIWITACLVGVVIGAAATALLWLGCVFPGFWRSL